MSIKFLKLVSQALWKRILFLEFNRKNNTVMFTVVITSFIIIKFVSVVLVLQGN